MSFNEMMAALPTRSWIGGEWIDDGSRLAVRDPGDGSLIAEISGAGVSTCLRAVDAAAAAFGSWRVTAPRVRAEILRRA